MKVASLFSGIGGFELGLRRNGHEVLSFCECDPAARNVLKHHFPGTAIHDDIRTLRSLPEGTTLATAGFPCQDLSPAGRTAGIFGAKSGLVGEVFRLLDASRPEWVILENVPFMLKLDKGAAMQWIVQELEKRGYRWAYRVLDPRDFGLPQRRPRVFLLASLNGSPSDVLFSSDPPGLKIENRRLREEACSYGFYWTEGNRGIGWAVNAVPALKGGSSVGIPSPPAVILRDRTVVTPDIADAERMQGFPAHWTKPGALGGRVGHRWRLVGNAVNVRVARWIGARLLKAGTYDGTRSAPLEAPPWPSAAHGGQDGRYCVADPEVDRNPGESLESFLRFPPRPLSDKAATGFLRRVKASTLRVPPVLIASLEEHLSRRVEPSRARF